MTDDTTPPPIERRGLDLTRLPYEIKRALGEEFILLDLLDPGSITVLADPEHDRIEVRDLAGEHLCWVPMYRLRPPHPELLGDLTRRSLRDLPGHVADQMAAAVNAGSFVVYEPSDSDEIYLDVDLGGEGVRVAAHRSTVVRGWPADDVPEVPDESA